jgi:capsid protein
MFCMLPIDMRHAYFIRNLRRMRGTQQSLSLMKQIRGDKGAQASPLFLQHVKTVYASIERQKNPRQVSLAGSHVVEITKYGGCQKNKLLHRYIVDG